MQQAVDDDDDEEESVDDSEQDRESEEGDGSNLSGDEEESAAEEGEDYVAGGSGDTRSIRSFESMLSASRRSAGDGKSKMSKARKSLSDRLASVSALAGRKVRFLLTSYCQIRLWCSVLSDVSATYLSPFIPSTSANSR